MKCSKCNRENDATSKFCISCGSSLTGDESSTKDDNWKNSQEGKFVIRFFKAKKKDWIVKKLAANYKMSQIEAEHLYENVRTAMVRYTQTPEYRREMANQGKRKMLFGLLWAGIGLTITIYSFTHPSNEGAFFIFWGAVLFGIIDFFRGLVQWLQYRASKNVPAVPGLTPVIPGYEPPTPSGESKIQGPPQWIKPAAILGGMGVVAAIIIVIFAHRTTPAPSSLTSSGGYKTTTTTKSKLALNDPSLTKGILAKTRIAFVSNQQIWVMNPDGSHLVQLTSKAADYQFLAWTPDGSKISFGANLDGSWNRYTINADGSNLVTGSAADPSAYGISPDGTKQAISKSPDSNNPNIKEIYVNSLLRDASHLQLTHDSADNEFPLWSPDGSRIAFNSNRDGHWAVYVINADGTGEQRLTDNAGDDTLCAWSPNGKKIAFISQRAENNNNQIIYVMNADGSGQKQLSNDMAFTLVWSPDGSKIAYIQNAVSTAGEQICIVNIDGSNKLQLTNKTGIYYNWLAWSP